MQLRPHHRACRHCSQARRWCSSSSGVALREPETRIVEIQAANVQATTVSLQLVISPEGAEPTVYVDEATISTGKLMQTPTPSAPTKTTCFASKRMVSRPTPTPCRRPPASG